jgi:hypothetical protein
MGFTWIFGFIGTFTDNTIIWHLFVMLNSSLGVFITMAFTFNKRTLTLLRRLFNNDLSSSGQLTRKSTVSSVQESMGRVKNTHGFDAI